jgi:hypothetical protein
MTELEKLCVVHNITCKAIPRLGHKSKTFPNHKSWYCVLNYGEHTECFVLYSNSEPTAADVIYCCIIDSYATDCSFKEWCSDFGYEQGLKVYNKCRKIGKRIRRLLNAYGDYFEQFRYAEH